MGHHGNIHLLRPRQPISDQPSITWVHQHTRPHPLPTRLGLGAVQSTHVSYRVSNFNRVSSWYRIYIYYLYHCYFHYVYYIFIFLLILSQYFVQSISIFHPLRLTHNNEVAKCVPFHATRIQWCLNRFHIPTGWRPSRIFRNCVKIGAPCNLDTGVWAFINCVRAYYTLENLVKTPIIRWPSIRVRPK